MLTFEHSLREMLELDECLEALQEENARDVNVIDLAGKWDGADYMIFITALSPRHMRRMADMFVQAVRLLTQSAAIQFISCLLCS